MNYIIFDLEATCWKNKTDRKREVIEIGAVKISEQAKMIDQFNAFVKPAIHPILSDFCQELTTIQQSDIDQADHFPEALHRFKNWINPDEKYMLCSWGFYDKKQLEQDCDLHQLDKGWLANHISLKHQHATINRLKRAIGLANALKHENLNLDGMHHRGIDDAKNISKIFLKYFDKWKF
ncbi:exonuclease domain-containing protein [Fulvivirga maritima]|uniref:3'-5' exonuclease n=1 Tax=Fulvivirga maritima TaxID=2904247 RepID=UPI001F2CE622|nr:3'-5' exonuclease [Fulvivirga maritima]UII26877.1 exonuclease domain-containing protein [Fulvivirga maritima]